jgi:hypothetical protein
LSAGVNAARGNPAESEREPDKGAIAGQFEPRLDLHPIDRDAGLHTAPSDRKKLLTSGRREIHGGGHAQQRQ